MKTRFQIVVLLTFVSLGLNAQPFSAPAENNAIQSQQIMTTGSNYNGTVYAPFDNTVPSEQSTVGASYSPAKAPGPRREGAFDGSPEVKEQDESYPLGDGVLPMLIMALAFGGAVYLRRRREA